MRLAYMSYLHRTKIRKGCQRRNAFACQKLRRQPFTPFANFVIKMVRHICQFQGREYSLFFRSFSKDFNSAFNSSISFWMFAR